MLSIRTIFICVYILLTSDYRHNMKLRSLLEHEPGAAPPAWAAAGVTGLTEPEAALTGTPLWELALLQKHYHPHLSQAAAAVAVIPPQGKPRIATHPYPPPPNPMPRQKRTPSVYPVKILPPGFNRSDAVSRLKPGGNS